MNKKYISVKGAEVHNLKKVSVDIPRNQFTVISGLSGSGKSSLAFNTIYAEGQRRFVESLSSYARQFLERLEKPNVESIEGLPPAVAIQQNTPSKNARSTVGTTTEIYDYLRLIWGRIGKTYCKFSGNLVKKDSPQSVAIEISKWKKDEKFYILFKINDPNKNINREIITLRNNGYSRILLNESYELLDTSEDEIPLNLSKDDFYFLADRLKVNDDTEFISRLTDSLEHAFMNGHGRVEIFRLSDIKFFKFSNIYEDSETGREYVEPEPRLFSFNNPFGACPKCQGFGRSIGYDENLIIPNKNLTIFEGAIVPFNYDSNKNIFDSLISYSKFNNLRIDIPYNKLSKSELKLLWDGDNHFIGIKPFFASLEANSYKVQNRVFLSKFRAYTKCDECEGSRLRTSARQVFVHEKNIPQIINMPLEDLYNWLNSIQFTEFEQGIIGQILEETLFRLSLLIEIGLGYLTLDRMTHTLSGGEFQRINLSAALGSSLVGTLYVLDEPSIGLHSRDTEKLLKILKRLRNIGNTIIVVEHDPDIITESDFLIDIGPKAGNQGGEIVYSGETKKVHKNKNSLTGNYLSGKKKIEIKTEFLNSHSKLILNNIFHNNLKIEKVEIPLGIMLVVTGVSGSGKSSLINDVLYPTLKQKLDLNNDSLLPNNISNWELIDEVEMVDQSSIGRSTRSTPVTYTKAFDYIRELFSNTQYGKQLGLTPGYFSFNVPGGRCEKCEGEGFINVDMQFLSDVSLVCEDCNGSRYKREARLVKYNNKSIVDVLDMTIDEALDFFAENTKISNKLQTLSNVGLGYLKLGQPSTMLSGGEAQRIKLANHLEDSSVKNKLFIFDEPTTGLHLEDISKLLKCFKDLVEKGHSVLIIEHNLYVIANADYIIDLGPDAGEKGGLIVDQGTPIQIAKNNSGFTSTSLIEFYKKQNIKI